MKNYCRFSEMISGTDCRLLSGSDPEITGICYDSRKAEKGSVFVALSGCSADGHKYARSAYDRGCRCFILEKDAGLPDDVSTAYTENTRKTLGLVSMNFFGHPERRIKLIGITGTKGKTSTALMIRGIFSAAGISCGYIGSNGALFAGKHFDTDNMTPESYEIIRLLSMMEEDGVTHAVLEVSSQALFNYRVSGLRFEACGFTNLSRDHISPAEHPTFEHYRDSKKRLFTDEYGASFVAYNADDPSSPYIIGESSSELMGYGIENGDYLKAEDIEKISDPGGLGVKFRAVWRGGDSKEIRLLTPGTFSVSNALCAMTVAGAFGIGPDTVAAGLENYDHSGRCEVVDTPVKDVRFIIDYAHNGVSLRSVLSEIRQYSPKRLVCVFGAIGDRTFERRRELAEAAGSLADFSVITSDNPGYEDPDMIIAEVESFLPEGADHICITDRAEAVRYAVINSQPGDVVLFAGKGHENYQYVRGAKVPFSERELILKYAGI
ncbi:MAG: UDP-N-acetylmuramoyl-L-alanyl-D-glutamate--2,6-diaminopimelate ligase [Clostridia bacterium]|nr:UDP-N-acetylmuramoyl-L-alanyl-D-glutamate--2,6-diaminopimelate ligase [Clostridia bacterium]